jgi:dGTPase
VKHSRDAFPAGVSELAEYSLDKRPPLEAQLIDLVDEIAYNTADLDDGFEARLLDLDQLRAEVPSFDAAYADVNRQYPLGRLRLKFNEAVKRILDHFATDLIENTRRQVEASGAQTVSDIRQAQKRLAGFSPGAAEESAGFKRFLNKRLYSHPAIAEERDRSVAALDSVFEFFMAAPERMPENYAELTATEPRHRVVCDYIAGMTDQFLLRRSYELLGPPEKVE